MKVYIQTNKKHEIDNDNFFKAYLGYKEMGLETVFFCNNEELRTSNREDIVVGYVGTVQSRLYDFGILTTELNYPQELSEYLGRKVWKSTINTINAQPEKWPIFVKSVQDKQFTGIVVREPKDLIGCGAWNDDQECWCSEVVDFVAEWRVFVLYGQIIDVRPYKGDWKVHYDASIIENAVKNYISAPAAYSIDFGYTKDGRTLLIEVNDGYALGSYGLHYPLYSRLLSARWAELTNTEDYCDFTNMKGQWKN